MSATAELAAAGEPQAELAPAPGKPQAAPPPASWLAAALRPAGAPPLPSLAEHARTALLASLGMAFISFVHYSPSALASGVGTAFGSLAATAALLYAAPKSPLTQPRNAVGGHFLSAVIGVGARVLIADSGAPGALPGAAVAAVVLSLLAMGACGVQHPAGGGTAFIAVTSAPAAALGWLFVPSVVIGAAMLVAVALLGNLVGRPYPLWW